MSPTNRNRKSRAAVQAGTKSEGKSTSDPVLGEAESVDQIREILFGGQMKEYEGRFHRVEERLSQDVLELRQEMRKRLDSLESFMKTELESLSQQICSEQEKREDATESVSENLKTLAQKLEGKITQVDQSAQDGLRDIREQVLQQSKSLAEEIRDSGARLSAALQQELQELRNDKTDRATLASLLTEVALRLQDEFKLPDAG